MSENKKPTNIQIFLFFIGFVTLFTLVFVLGVIVGKGLSNKGVAELDTKIESPSLSEGSESEGISEPDAEFDEPESDIYEDNVIAKNDDKPLLDDKTEEIAEQAEKEVSGQIENPDIEPAIKENEKSNEKAVENELGYVKKAETAKLPPDALPPTDPEGKYTVQIGSFRDKGGAEKILNRYIESGYPAFIKTVEIDDDQKWYRVRIGTFGSRDVAKIYFEVLKKREKDINGFITTNN